MEARLKISQKEENGVCVWRQLFELIDLGQSEILQTAEKQAEENRRKMEKK